MEIRNDTYIKEVEELKSRMIKAEKWAEKMPLFEKQIIEQKISSEENYRQYSMKYKSIPLAWGVNRGYFELGTSRYMTNNTKKHKGYYWNIYINSYSLFNNHDNYGLKELLNTIDVYYFDKMNTTAYVTDEQIEGLLELLNDWYIDSSKKAKEESLLKKKQKLEEELKRINNETK